MPLSGFLSYRTRLYFFSVSLTDCVLLSKKMMMMMMMMIT